MIKRLGLQPIGKDVALLRVLLGKCGLAQPGGWLPFSCWASLVTGITSNTDPYSCTIPRAMTIRSWAQAAYVAAPNDASNYWNIYLTRTDGTILDSYTTIAAGPAAWRTTANTEINAAVSRSHYGLLVKVTKVGSPGALYLHGPAVFAI